MKKLTLISIGLMSLSVLAGCGKKHEHEFVDLIPEVLATCTSTGMAAHYVCSCGKYFDENKAETTEGQLVLPVLTSHNWETNWSSDDTYHWHKCSNPECGETNDKGEHSWVEEPDKYVEPTCTETGTQWFKCSTCGKEKAVPVVEAGHDYDYEHAVASLSADKTSATLVAKCKNNSDHTVEATNVTLTKGAYSAPACETAGKQVYSVTGYFGENKVTVSLEDPIRALGHNFDYDNPVVHQHGNCEDDEVIWYYCTNDGCDKYDEEIVTHPGHSAASEWSTGDVNGVQSHWHDCLNDGCDAKLELGTCVAGTEYGSDEEYHWLKCSVCGGGELQKAPHNVTSWTIDKDSTWRETGLKHGTCTCGKEVEEIIPKKEMTPEELASEIANLKIKLDEISTVNVDGDYESEMRMEEVEKYLEETPQVVTGLETDTTGCKEVLAAKRHYVSGYASGETAYDLDKDHWFFNIDKLIPEGGTKADHYEFSNDSVIGDTIKLHVGKNVDPWAGFMVINNEIGSAEKGNLKNQNLLNDDALTMYFAIKSSTSFKFLVQALAGFAGSDYNVTVPANKWTTIVIPRWNFLSYQAAWKANPGAGLQLKVGNGSVLPAGAEVEMSDIRFIKNPYEGYDGQVEWSNSFSQCSGQPLDITDQASFDAALAQYGMLFTGTWCNRGTNTTTYTPGTKYYACKSPFVYKEYNQYKHNINATQFFTGAQFVQNHAFLTDEDSTKSPAVYSGYEYWNPFGYPAGGAYTPFEIIFPDIECSEVTIPVFVNKALTFKPGNVDGLRFMPKVNGAAVYDLNYAGAGETLLPGWNFITTSDAKVMTQLKAGAGTKFSIGLYYSSAIEAGTGIYVGSVMYKLAQ
ncbi:MAG: hypothetical protein MJ248_03825 [Bacilli bacterium]|nr:hypothetical protein [Bacilli bacterium]